jgi:hypothetical protein
VLDRAIEQVMHEPLVPERGRTTKQTSDHASASSRCGMVRELTRAR